MRNIIIFHNPHAAKGKSQKGLQKVIEALHQKNITYKVFETQPKAEDNKSSLQTATKEFTPTEIWVSGGDGTLHALINSLPAEMWQLPVAVLPTGSGNDFVKNLTAKPTLENCLDIALNGRPMPADVWDCNGQLFIHGLGIGFDGQVVESMSKTGSFFSGHLAYYYHVLRLVLGYREKTFTMVHNGIQKRFPCFMLTLGNSTTFGGGFKITPQANISDGLLDVCAISKVPVLRRPFCMKTVEKGRHLSLPFVNYFKTSELTLTTQQTVPGHIDGELFYGNEFTIKPFGRKLQVKMYAQ